MSPFQDYKTQSESDLHVSTCLAIHNIYKMNVKKHLKGHLGSEKYVSPKDDKPVMDQLQY